MSPSTATLQFGRLAEQSPLTGYEPKSLVEVSSERTPIILFSRRGSLDTNVDDLAITLDWMRLKSATQQTWDHEVSAIPFGVSCSQTHSSMEKSRRDVEQFSSFGKPLSKGKGHRDLGSAQMERERILSEHRKCSRLL